MNKTALLAVFFFAFFINVSFAQNDSIQKPRIAVFAPLYLDTLFDATGNYKMGKSVPGYSKQGIEFYQGAMMALDSLDKEGITLDVQVFDTKGKKDIFKIADSHALDGVDMLLGAVSGSEYLDLAAIAKEKKIPFISATYPNDGGISGNPYVVVVNSKLNTHIQAIYNYILKNLGTNKIIMFRRQNGADDRVTEVFKSLNTSASGSVLNIQTVVLNTPAVAADVEAALDKDRENVIICGSLDDNFAKTLLGITSGLSAKYKITLVGMPTWEGFTELDRTDVRMPAVIYSTAFYNPGEEENNWVDHFTREYGKSAYTLPSEIAFRGYELTYLFGHMLNSYGDRLLENIGEKKFRVLTDFDFKPIRWSKNATTADYYENKRIFIVKKQTGELTKIN
ncbi:MAG: ABC transporter substrate-binding protein [Agriterribacter sp.]